MASSKQKVENQAAAALFEECRQALRMTLTDIQDLLCILDLTSIRRMQTGENSIHGPTWVALWYRLDQELDDNPSNAAEIHTLMDRVEAQTDAIGKIIQERRALDDQKYQERQARKSESEG